MKDWIITRIAKNLDTRSAKEFPLRIEGVNLNASALMYGDTNRYFEWRVRDVYDSRYDIGKAVIADDVPLVLMQECRRNG
jgi:hypothetical protein